MTKEIAITMTWDGYDFERLLKQGWFFQRFSGGLGFCFRSCQFLSAVGGEKKAGRFAIRFRRQHCSGNCSLRRHRRGGRVLQGDQGGADELALKSVAGGDGVEDLRVGHGGGLGIGRLMPFRIERLVAGGNKWNQAGAARHITTGILKIAQLLDQARLTGADGGFVQGVGVVKDAHDDLDPFAFHAPQFFHFEAQSGFLGVVGLLHEFRERRRFGIHPFGDIPGGDNRAGRKFLNVLPLGSRIADLAGEEVEILDLRDGRNERAGLNHFNRGAVFEHKWNDGEHCAKRAGEQEKGGLPLAHGSFVLRVYEPGQTEEDGITENKKWPFWQLGFQLISHKWKGYQSSVVKLKFIDARMASMTNSQCSMTKAQGMAKLQIPRNVSALENAAARRALDVWGVPGQWAFGIGHLGHAFQKAIMDEDAPVIARLNNDASDLSSTREGELKKTWGMRMCVIFNPTAKGEKAKKFRRHLEMIGAECALKQTVAAGGARPLAAQAVKEGFETIVAAGGDGTLNEVLNGMGDVPGGFEHARLGVLPLGTVNVFAKELGLPMGLKQSFQVLREGKETIIDLPRVEYSVKGKPEQRYFAQLAGAGLDARAIELVDWDLKKKLGPLAYVWAGFAALREPASKITATSGTESASGELVLVGNGKFYGGRYRLFPKADLCDGVLEVCVFYKTNWMTLMRCAGLFFAGAELPTGVAKCFRAEKLTLSSTSPTPMEVDGENIGHLPATFSIQQKKLRVVAP